LSHRRPQNGYGLLGEAEMYSRANHEIAGDRPNQSNSDSIEMTAQQGAYAEEDWSGAPLDSQSQTPRAENHAESKVAKLERLTIKFGEHAEFLPLIGALQSGAITEQGFLSALEALEVAEDNEMADIMAAAEAAEHEEEASRLALAQQRATEEETQAVLAEIQRFERHEDEQNPGLSPLQLRRLPIMQYHSPNTEIKMGVDAAEWNSNSHADQSQRNNGGCKEEAILNDNLNDSSLTAEAHMAPGYRVASKHPDNLCVMCQYPFEEGDELLTLPCFHAFHSECIEPWLRQSKACPVCKEKVTVQ